MRQFTRYAVDIPIEITVSDTNQERTENPPPCRAGVLADGKQPLGIESWRQRIKARQATRLIL